MNYFACWVGSNAVAFILGCGGAELAPTGGTDGGAGTGGPEGGGGFAGAPQVSFCDAACTSPCLAAIEASDPDILNPGEGCIEQCAVDVPTDCQRPGSLLVACLEQNSCEDGPECEDAFFVFGECVAFADAG